MWPFIRTNKHNRELRRAELNIIERLEIRLKKEPDVFDDVVDVVKEELERLVIK